jgi:DNA-binding NarL/FixJ family response regulator
MTVIATLVVEDEQLAAEAHVAYLERLPAFTLAGVARTAQEALAALRDNRVDLVLLDVNLPDMDGFEVAARLAREGSDAAIVLTSSRDRADFGPLVDGSPARGFVPKAELSGDALLALIA